MTIDRALRSTMRFLTEAFTQNLGLKALSLVAALSLAAYSRGQLERTQRTIQVGVLLRLPPERENRELMTPMPAHVDVTVVGTTRAVDRLVQTALSPVELDLREGTPDTISFERGQFSLPPDIELKFVDPPSLSLEWQAVVTRTLPLQASRTGQPARGYDVKGSLEVEPREIRVRGPERLVEVLQFARLAAFDLSGLTDGVYRRRLAIDEPPPRVRYLDAKSATVTVVVARRQLDVKFKHRAVEVIGLPRARVTPSAVDVTAIGPPEVIAGLRAEQLVPRVNLASAGIDPRAQRHGSATLKVRVELNGAETECQPPAVTVTW